MWDWMYFNNKALNYIIDMDIRAGYNMNLRYWMEWNSKARNIRGLD